jgi:hypothetical protein
MMHNSFPDIRWGSDPQGGLARPFQIGGIQSPSLMDHRADLKNRSESFSSQSLKSKLRPEHDVKLLLVIHHMPSVKFSDSETALRKNRIKEALH